MKLKISPGALNSIQKQNDLKKLLKSFFKEGISDEDFYNLLLFSKLDGKTTLIDLLDKNNPSLDLKNENDINYLIKHYFNTLCDMINKAFVDDSLMTNDDGLYELNIEIDQEEARIKPDKPKKPSFYFLKSFLRLFSKNLFKDEFDDYSAKLNDYQNKLSTYEGLKYNKRPKETKNNQQIIGEI